MDKRKVLDRIGESRELLLRELEGLDEEAMTETPVEGVWTIKDLIGHVAAWEEVCLPPLRNFSEGGAFDADPIPDHDVWNEAQSARRQNWTLRQVLDDLHLVRQELLRLSAKLDDAQWKETVTLPWGEEATMVHMISGLAWHEREHLKSIRRGREQ